MNKKLRNLFVMAFTLVLASCVGEVADPADNADVLGGNVAAVTEQVASVNNSLELLSSLGEVVEFDLTAVQSDMENHVRYLMSGVSSVDATIASLELQKNVAAVVGELQVEGYESLSGPFAKSLKSWIGDDFVTFFDVAVYRGKVHAVAETAALRFADQYDFIDAVRSDVEAGLREGVGVKELSSTADDIQNNISLTEEIVANADAVLESLEVECTVAIESMLGNSKDYNPESLKKANAQASAQLKSAEPSIAELAARIEAMQEKVDGIDSRLSGLEADVEGLLGMIQSVTFLSEYSEDYAVAYYEMNDNSKVSAPGKAYDGKNQRDPAGTIELSYMVRPASAAAAVTSDVVSVVGYYANQLQTKAIDPNQFVNFEVQSVELINSERGILTVTLSHDLKDDFYYKATGAKCALFIATGKTDVSSKFVELIPKDNSTTVYVEGLKINTDDFEIDEGQSKNLTVTVNPATATNKTVTWASSNTEIATIDQYSGALTAVKQGNVTITATTNGIDEWGDNLTAYVNVKVNPSIRLGGPLYVEEGKTAELSLDFPPAMNIESKVWMSSDVEKATVENGIVTGVAHTYNEYTYQYNPVTITCIVNGNITLTHEMSVVVPQPRQIKLNNYGDDVKSVTMKLDQTISLAGTILPSNVDASLFRMTYESDGGLGWINFDNGEIKTPGSIGGRYVYIKVRDKDKNTYMKTFVERTVVVNVEPYYVETMKFAQETITLAPDQTTVLSPVFTSDVDGKQPSYTSLNWVSSNPSVVSVNSTTGEISTLKEGSAVITATTTDANAVPSGQSAKSASCTVVVETPVAPINIGDYFYSDGTWSSERDYSKTVIGIVFSNAGAATSDPILMKDCPKATHGLVVGLTEYNSIFGKFGYSSVYGWLTDNGYPTPNTDLPNGYGLTKGMTAYRDANSGYAELYDRTSGPVAKHKVSLPSGVSSWYIPSFKEMKWLHENKTVVNAALSNAGGTQITGSLYWLSTLRTYNSYNDCQDSPFDMYNGAWYAYPKGSTSYPVRVVFAF